jgi:tagatose-1,6-bisphosphate aldolase non-catalytic subunit AgaZ/GatZ
MKFSLYDRIRYYWFNERVEAALKKLFTNLHGLRTPASLIHQNLPDIVEDISGALVIDPFELINLKIRLSLEKYHRACQNAQV